MKAKAIKKTIKKVMDDSRVVYSAAPDRKHKGRRRAVITGPTALIEELEIVLFNGEQLYYWD